ncbi:MAG TPA: ribonuclease D [Candidatus Nanoarchaeia archaeon]|nr:ribonuclease D [Candidatus Nanoarchaeia archaeon]
MVSFTYVDTKEGLLEAAAEWRNSEELAIDLECENNLHHYGSYITLIQISDLHKNWIVDVLKLKEIAPLIDTLENSSIQKIFHDVSFDFRILHEQFASRPRNIFDTQIAALLLGKEHLGLGDLLKEYLGIEKERKYQMADWTKRPLDTQMLSYAVNDTLYLIQLRDLLKKELQEKKRLLWAEEEFTAVENAGLTYKEQTFLDVRGSRELTPEQLGSLKRLFLLRQQMAKKVNRPVHFILNNNRLKEYALHPPHWEKVRGVHPIVRQEHQLFSKAVEEGKEEIVNIPIKEKKRSTTEQKALFEKLNETQQKIAQKAGIKGHLIINKEQMAEVIFAGNKNCLRKWQQKLLEEEGFKL